MSHARRLNATAHAPRMRVDVTAEHIRDGRKRNSRACMTAQAVIDICAARGVKADNVHVDLQTIRFSDLAKRQRYVYLTPQIVQRSIVRWDQAEKNKGVDPTEVVPPFTFRLAGGMVVATKISGSKVPRQASIKTDHARVVRRVGGAAPPKISMRREFGLRAFDR